MPDAPATLSTYTVAPIVLDTSLAMTRAMVSVADPGPVGTMSRTGRFGQSSACAPMLNRSTRVAMSALMSPSVLAAPQEIDRRDVVFQDLGQLRRRSATEAAIGRDAEVLQMTSGDGKPLGKGLHIVDHAEIDARISRPNL